MKKVLVTGGTGLLGLGLLSTLPKNIEAVFTYNAHKPTVSLGTNNGSFVSIDLTNKKEISKIFSKYKFDVVIHAASIGNVDYCENNPELCRKVNVTSTKYLIEACKKSDASFVYISTNAVFDGKNAPYNESSLPNPTNYYGVTKLESELLVQKSGLKHAIIRPVLLFGWNAVYQRKNPVTWLIEELTKKNKIFLVDDIFNNPLLNIDAAKSIWSIVQNGKTGIYHIAGADRVNRYELGLMVCDIFSFNPSLIKKVSSDYFSGIVPRMPDTTYSTEKIKKELNIVPEKLINALIRMKKNQQKWQKN